MVSLSWSGVEWSGVELSSSCECECMEWMCVEWMSVEFDDEDTCMLTWEECPTPPMQSPTGGTKGG